MIVLLLAAGKSERFGRRPKFMEKAPDSRYMAQHALDCFTEYQRVNIVTTRDISEEWAVRYALEHGNYHITELAKQTQGPVETVLQTIEKEAIGGPLFVKDCDTFFRFPGKHPTEENGVCTVELKDYPGMRNVGGKSFVMANDQGIIWRVVEKQIVSGTVSVGGYSFREAADFAWAARALLRNATHEIYISHVIEHLINAGHVFSKIPVEKFVDVGTRADWELWEENYGN